MLAASVPASAQTASRAVTGDGAELTVSFGDESAVVARHDGAAWARTKAVSLRAAGTTSPVEIVVSGLSFGYVFADCDGVTVAAAEAVEGAQTLNVPEGDCAVGAVSVFNDDATIALVVRETAVPAPAPVTLAFDGPLAQAETVLRDETGTVRPVTTLDRLMRHELFVGAPLADGRPFRLRLVGTVQPVGAEVPLYRYSAPNGLGYRFDWSLRSWPSAPTRYHFKGQLDDLSGDRTMENTAADLRKLVVDYDLPESVGSLYGAMSWTAYDRSGAGIPIERTNWYVCDPPSLPPPHVQAVYEMADPAVDFMARDGQFEIVLDEANGLWDPAADGPIAAPCSELKPGDKYAVASALVQRGADGVSRSFAVERVPDAGVVLGDTLQHGLAPLAFTPRLRRGVSRVTLSVAENFALAPPAWPLGTAIRAPLVDAQHGDARPAPMPFEIYDADGTVVSAGPDLTSFLSLGLPADGVRLTAGYTDPVVRVGGAPAGVEIDLGMTPGAPDPAPPYLKRLTLSAGGAYTATVPVGTGVVQVAVGDADGVVAGVEAAVRPGGTDAWAPLALTADGANAYRADLDLAGGVYDLRIVATDAAGNEARYVSTPAFEVSGIVSAEAEPDAEWLGAPAPNPAATHATFGARLGAPGSLRAELFDVLGRRVRVAEVLCPGGACALRVDVRPLPPGVYFARVSAGERRATRRLVVAR